ncbi:outer membrane lipoprotein chaperone LolA [Salinibius halmophilus]|uniref:outer membrane lipoprotein chaperone LolA n=1 Tax=Salinibius halmophilus TaxID=1853216 RepID=UPI000E66E174|nr:outer membrane lipoprotein chaperone LolA [Salinibius halmophilus]
MIKQLKLIGLLLLPLTAVASPLQSLQSLLAPIESLKAEFLQTTFADLGSMDYSQVEGELVIAKPDLLYWYAALPFEQTLVADGQYYWVWDKDLEQATKEDLGDRIANSPAGLLTSGPQAIGERFTVRIDDVSGDIESYELIPHQADQGYEKVVMTFANEIPKEVEIHDSFGGATMLMLKNVELNGDISPAQFQLELPDDTDLIDMTR